MFSTLTDNLCSRRQQGRRIRFDFASGPRSFECMKGARPCVRYVATVPSGSYAVRRCCADGVRGPCRTRVTSLRSPQADISCDLGRAVLMRPRTSSRVCYSHAARAFYSRRNRTGRQLPKGRNGLNGLRNLYDPEAVLWYTSIESFNHLQCAQHLEVEARAAISQGSFPSASMLFREF